MLTPSIYQKKIIDWLYEGRGHACINAVAGSGKSSTLKLAALNLAEFGYKLSEIKIVVFGKANSLDLVNKLGDEWKYSVCTLHSAGWYLIRQFLRLAPREGRIDERKYELICQKLGLVPSRRSTEFQLSGICSSSDFLALIDLVRLTNAEIYPEVLRELAAHFHLENVLEYEQTALFIAQVLAYGERQATEDKLFDFTDQIWLPVRWNLGSSHYKYIFVDEAQDLNAIQLELVLNMARGKGCRLLAVGDPFQAIMGFAGADNQSYYKIRNRLKATELPLSLCYRCPKSHLDLVNEIFPQIGIEPLDTAKDGKLEVIHEENLANRLKDGDLVISRKTAPIVSLCISLIAKGIAAKVKGRDISKQLAKEMEAIAKLPGFQFKDFNEWVDRYRKIKLDKLKGLRNEKSLTISLNDRLEAILAINSSCLSASKIGDLIAYVKELFSDDSSPITLSTCHRAKGLEADRVFLYRPGDMPITYKEQPEWEYQQERNLLYVALTRAKSELFIVGKAKWMPEAKDKAKKVVALANEEI